MCLPYHSRFTNFNTAITFVHQFLCNGMHRSIGEDWSIQQLFEEECIGSFSWLLPGKWFEFATFLANFYVFYSVCQLQIRYLRGSVPQGAWMNGCFWGKSLQFNCLSVCLDTLFQCASIQVTSVSIQVLAGWSKSATKWSPPPPLSPVSLWKDGKSFFSPIIGLYVKYYVSIDM